MTIVLQTMRRLVLLASVSAMAVSATAFAQGGAGRETETVLVPGSRDGCPMLQLLNVVPMEVKDNLLTLPADVNGKPHTFLFDTAAITEQMTEDAAERLGLHAASSYMGPAITGNFNEAYGKASTGGFQMPEQDHGMVGSPLLSVGQVYDSRGKAYSGIAKVGDFMMKTMQNKDVEFHISPLPPPSVDGVLSLKLFDRFDIDMNFSAGRFNLFSKDHCAGKVLYWRASGVTALPFLTRDNRVFTRVMLDGRELTAVIDTGSPVTVLRFDAAARLFDIAPDSPGVTLVGEKHASNRQDLYTHDFKTLSFGSVALGNPHVLLTRAIQLVQGTDTSPQTGTLLRNDGGQGQPDMIIGMDMLKLTHLYVATRERVLYVTQGPELAPDALGAQPVIPVTPFRP